MKFENIESLPGSPEPADIFEPHMPGVDLLSDMEGFFIQVRQLLEADNTDNFVQKAGLGLLATPEDTRGETPKGQRYVAVITPGRMISLAPAPLPNTKSEKELASVKSILPSEKPLQITAISYTKLQAYMEDKTKTKCIPFLGFMLAFAYLGHNVIVFEGHPSALEFGVKNSDVLFIDSGMLPFLQENWAEVAFQSMKPNSSIFLHDRNSYALLPVVKKNSPPGWRTTEPDGEASYTNLLLTYFAQIPDKTRNLRITSGLPLPNLKEFTTNPDELEYISLLPFDYQKLDADTVIKIIWDTSAPANFLDFAGILKSKQRKLKAKVVLSGNRTIELSFKLSLSKTSDGKQQLDVSF